ncbi:MAG TPA: hypothetical protein PLJ46_17375, partial [Burkholderiaceae bacterium]|nr:hypothetical protein [Burkholderiaceae bacterium]
VSGDGGRVIVWSDRQTLALGSVSAHGGTANGDGGFAEISGKQRLFFDGQVDLGAARGLAGTLLLDPLHIIVANGGGAVATDVDQFTDLAGTTQTVSPNTLDLVGGNVVLQATENINFNDPLSLTTLNASLTAQAGGIITVDAAISTNLGDITLYANAPGSGGPGPSGSAVRVNAPIISNGGNIVLRSDGQAGFDSLVLNATINAGAGTLALTGGGGLINQTAGNVLASGATTINAGSSDALLGSTGNDFSSVAVSAAHITLVDANALTLSSLSQLANRNLYLQAVAGLLTVPVGAIDTGTAQLSLISGAGAFTTPGALSGSDIVLVGGTSLTLAHNVTASGNMTLFSSGALTQSAGTTVSSAGTMGVNATGTLTIQGGAGSPTAMVSTGNQTISAANIQLLGGATGSNASAAIKMLGAAGTQDITASNGITITGGADGGGIGVGNYGSIASNGDQVITVGNGGITLTGGGGSLADNFASIEHNGGAGTSQFITVNGTGNINLQAGSSAGVGAGAGSEASIRSDLGDSQTILFTGSGIGRAINITGGAVGGDAYAEIYAGQGTQSITGAGLITLTGGASGGGASFPGNDSTGNLAAISADNNDQTIVAGGLVLQGGGGGLNNFAVVYGGGEQSITVGAGGLQLFGGSGGLSEAKNAASVLKGNDVPGTSQVITVNGGGAITLQGGSSSDLNVGYDNNLLGLSNGSFAMIRSDGVSQLIEFTAPGGSISMAGGTTGSNNFAFIQAVSGSQTIRGSSAANAPTISLAGGASGGVTNEGNRALIGAEVGTQIINASSISLTGGAADTENLAQIRQGGVSAGLTETQTITIGSSGSLTLSGGGGNTNLARIQSYGVTQTVDLNTGGTLD